MNLKEIKDFINLMNENNLQELEIEREGLRIRIKKVPTGGYQTSEETSEKLMPIPGKKIEAKPEEKIEGLAKKLVPIKAPMVGTFYRAPSPEANPYAEVGQEIEVGQVVCIIEAMKLMNEIKSEIKGKIVEILVENGQPVEFGQPLFMVEPYVL